ncbi:MAG: pilin [bacterium]|nr:pilin [bacterium]
MKRNKNLVFGAVFVLLVFASLFVFQGASAQTTAGPTGFENICGRDAQGNYNIGTCVQQIYILALGLGAIVALLMIILAGYRYMTASGNAQQVEGAKEAFASAFIGLIVIFVAFILLYLVNPDLVRFRGLTFPAIQKTDEKQSGGGFEDPDNFAAAAGFVEAAGIDNAGVGSSGEITIETATEEQLVLTPSLTSSLPDSVSQTLVAYDLDPSSLSIIEYDVNDPSLLPDTITDLMGGDQPSRILVVVGSLFVFNAEAMALDTSGGLILDAVATIALNHYGVNIATITPPPGSPPPGGITPPSAGGYRYIKISSRKSGWISWREIEAYNTAGVKITPVSAQVSCDWCNTNYIKGARDIGAIGLYDGNYETVWNAGETCEELQYFEGLANPWSCPFTSLRAAWAVVDYGSSQNFSRVRFKHNGGVGTLAFVHDYYEADQVLVSNDGVTFRPVYQFNAPPAIQDHQWLEYNFSHQFAGDPTARITVNGQRSVTINPIFSRDTDGSTLVNYPAYDIAWSSSNADNVSYTASYQQTSPAFSNDCVTIQSQEWKFLDPFPFHAATVNGSKRVQPTFCFSGTTITFTYTARQLATGKTVTDRVTVQMAPVVYPEVVNP